MAKRILNALISMTYGNAISSKVFLKFQCQAIVCNLAVIISEQCNHETTVLRKAAIGGTTRSTSRKMLSISLAIDLTIGPHDIIISDHLHD